MTIRRMRDEETGEILEIDLDDDEQPTQPPQDQPRTNSEWAAKRKAETRADKAEKELAFLKAGINPDDPKAKWFVKGYDGKITPEDIKSAATEAGILAAPADPTAPVLDEVDTQTLDAQGRIAAAGQGASPDLLTDEARLEQAYATGGTEAMLAVARELGLRTVGPQ